MSAFHDALVAWDRSTFLAINHGLRTPLMDAIMPAVSDLGLGHVQAIVIFAGAFLFALGNILQTREISLTTISRVLALQRWWVSPMLVALIISGMASTVIKNTFNFGMRPWWFYQNEHLAGRLLDSEGLTVNNIYPLKVRRFPSGHTTTSTAIASALTVLALRRRRLAVIAGILWILAALVAISRIYLASHWPLDIVGGTLLGAVCGATAVWVCQAWAIPKKIIAQPPAEGVE